MHVVMISKALVIGAYHSKLKQLAALPDMNLTAIVPPSWRDERGRLELERTASDGYQLIVSPLRFNGNFHLHYYPQLHPLLKRLKPDLVHIDEEPYNLATFLAQRSANALGARTVFFSWQNLRRRYPPPFCWFESYILRRAAAGIVGNHDAVRVWRAKGYSGPLAVIPQVGVEPEVFKPLDSAEATVDRFRVGYAGRFVEEKGVDLLLAALAALGGTWQADLVGSGPERARLGELARRLQIADRVHFRSWLPSAQTVDYYRALDVLVLPSRSRSNWKEQFGRVLVDAMACGVPVIGSTCGEIPNVIGGAGLIFTEGDATALGDRLRDLQHDRALRRELGQRGRQRVLAHFTQEQIARQTYEVYQNVLRRS